MRIRGCAPGICWTPCRTSSSNDWVAQHLTRVCMGGVYNVGGWCLLLRRASCSSTTPSSGRSRSGPRTRRRRQWGRSLLGRGRSGGLKSPTIQCIRNSRRPARTFCSIVCRPECPPFSNVSFEMSKSTPIITQHFPLEVAHKGQIQRGGGTVRKISAKIEEADVGGEDVEGGAVGHRVGVGWSQRDPANIRGEPIFEEHERGDQAQDRKETDTARQQQEVIRIFWIYMGIWGYGNRGRCG